MSAVLEVREPSARYLEALQPALMRQFELLTTAPGAVARLRELILALALQGKLVRQDARDEPASALLERIAGERTRLIAAGKLRRSKESTAEDESEPPISLPPGWAWSKLAAIGVINPRNDAADDVVASFVQMSSIPIAFNDPHATEARPWRDIKSGFTQFAESDVGVAKITPCFENGKSTVFQNLSNGIGAGTTELHIVRPLCGVVPRYVLLFLKSPGFLRGGEATMTGTAGQKRLPRAYFENSPFSLPPLAEQVRIVARVDELMHLCDALEAKGRLEAAQHARLLGTLLGTLIDSRTPEELAANWQRVADHFDLLLDRPEALDALEQTILQLAVRGVLVPQDSNDVSANALIQDIRAEKDRMLADGQIKRDKPLPPIAEGERPFELPSGWAWVTLDSLASQITDGAHHTPNYVQAGVPFLSVKDLSSGVIDFSDTRFISSEAHRDLAKRCNPEFGDLLLTKIGTTGIAVVVATTAPFSLFVSVALIKLPAISARQDFLALVINSPFVRQQSEDGTEGVGNKNLVLRKIRAFRIPLPPLGEQSRIVARVEELRRLCANLRERLTASQTTQSHLAEALVAEVA